MTRKIKQDPMNDVRTNKIVIDSWDPVKIDAEYDFFQVISDENKEWIFLSRMADEIITEKNICSVRYMSFDDNSKSVFIVMSHSDINHESLNNYIKKSGNEYCKIRKYGIREMMQHWKIETVQLLLNSIKWIDIKDLRFNNVTGRHMSTMKAWYEQGQFRALELKIKPYRMGGEDSMILSPDVHTFTRYELISDYGYKQHKSELTQYELDANFDIHRASKLSADNYTMRQFHGRKSSITYFDVKNPKKFYESKVGVMLKAIKMFNMVFEEKMHISFDHWTQMKHETITISSIKAFDTLIKERMKSFKFSITDFVNDEKSRQCIEDIVSIFRSVFGTVLESLDIPDSEHLNICVIDGNSKTYKERGMPDPYTQYGDCIVNHLTIENFMKDSKKKRSNKSKEALIGTIIKELFIKDDLKNHRITIDDWGQRGYQKDITFATIYEEKDTKQYVVNKMIIHPNGNFDICCMNEAECRDDISNAIIESAEQLGKGKIEGAVMDGSGNINIICTTDIITVPEDDILRIMDENAKKGRKSIDTRNWESKNNVIHGNLDIRSLKFRDEMYYFVGDIGGTPHQDTNAPNVRRIALAKGSEFFFNDLLKLMKVFFVKYKSPTVTPYPLKYLNEYTERIRKKARSNDEFQT